MNQALAINQAIGWIGKPTTGWAMTALLVLLILAGGHVMPQANAVGSAPGLMPEHRATSFIAPTRTPAIQASGQRATSPQKWVF
jgi:hypothetical protein